MEKRRAKYGPNQLTPPKQKSIFVIFCTHVFSPFNMVLWVAATLAFIVFGLDSSTVDFVSLSAFFPFSSHLFCVKVVIGGILVVVIFVTGSFAFFQDVKSAKVMEGLKNSKWKFYILLLIFSPLVSRT